MVRCELNLLFQGLNPFTTWTAVRVGMVSLSGFSIVVRYFDSS